MIIRAVGSSMLLSQLIIDSIFSELLLKFFKKALKFSVQLGAKEKLQLNFDIDYPGDRIDLSSGFYLVLCVGVQC